MPLAAWPGSEGLALRSAIQCAPGLGRVGGIYAVYAVCFLLSALDHRRKYHQNIGRNACTCRRALVHEIIIIMKIISKAK